MRVVWTVLPAVFFLNLPLDLIEALLYGREWQLGYDKLPPLPWWMLEATYRVFGPDLFFYALSQATVVAAFALIWAHGAAAGRPGRRAGRGPDHRRPALFHVHGARNSITTSSNCRSGRWPATPTGRRSATAGPCIGSCSGSASAWRFWAKYFVVVLAGPLVLFALFDRDARKALVTPGPWIAIGGRARWSWRRICVWLVQNDFLPFAYADARAVQFKGPLDYLIKPPEFLLSQLGFLLPSLADRGALSAAGRPARRTSRACPLGRRLRPPHRHAAGVRAGGDGRAACRS